MSSLDFCSPFAQRSDCYFYCSRLSKGRPRNNANHTLNAFGLVNATGGNVANSSSEILTAVGFTYDACLSQCGSGTQKPNWANISQQFSAWLLPYLALISHLPFGARHRVDNLMSAILTIGSPLLAGYSMILTILNARWISRRFENVSFPNAKHAVRILISLQQTPLKITNEDSLLSSLIVLPENDDWWPKVADSLDYTLTWSIASATSIAWVTVTYLLAFIGSISDINGNLNSNGQGAGSIWLWLIPIVIGWLQLSPKCDYVRIKRAMDNADAMAFVATYHGVIKASDLSERRAISIDSTLEHSSSPDESLIPPIYNYARAIPWSRSAEDIFDAFLMASNNSRMHRPVKTGDIWKNAGGKNVWKPVRSQCLLYGVRSPWASGIFFRMFMAWLLSMALQWATTGAAVMVVYFTPTMGLGCRSLGYILYGALATIVWAMLVTSSIISHYTYLYSARSSWSPFFSITMRLAKVLSDLLRWSGKFLATVNAVWLITASMLQFADVYDNCYCNSSALGRGVQHAYNIVMTDSLDLGLTETAWWGGLALACSTSVGFVFFMSLWIDLVPT
ncbi:uncharacterized protein HD556DRAFT_1495779 [Suillus plorans]|uniref:Uncharacterized protein n=1 Tax=Suillus plorans TaxID=116603 RepID=A0A9P7AGL7_9AGAM|nr:uncharacterized protein HD556DRAFT_1495779 [Suillus plorans]KAG1788940.1 hypothetical protein HD556DRAFT_1495779 [Suillus plorans]